jgi:hypothetical protein
MTITLAVGCSFLISAFILFSIAGVSFWKSDQEIADTIFAVIFALVGRVLGLIGIVLLAADGVVFLVTHYA